MTVVDLEAENRRIEKDLLSFIQSLAFSAVLRFHPHSTSIRNACEQQLFSRGFRMYKPTAINVKDVSGKDAQRNKFRGVGNPGMQRSSHVFLGRIYHLYKSYAIEETKVSEKSSDLFHESEI